ncbi:MAG: 4-hydroxyphenylacetate 3-monooxygenase, oxygenase component, partial [Proteobacteria bacterium]|nr:4-hydroxyphenylacetate 3-monooxygenase, oxygenase component [Pseudomonadota bacterium]
MGSVTGAQFLSRLDDGRDVWIEGQKVENVTTHPLLRRGAATLAQMLDRQHEDANRDVLTYSDQPDGERFATSFLPPRSIPEVEQRGRAFYDWARWSGGMMGRSPDYLNSSFMAFNQAADYFSSNRPEFADNVRT